MKHKSRRHRNAARTRQQSQSRQAAVDHAGLVEAQTEPEIVDELIPLHHARVSDEPFVEQTLVAQYVSWLGPYLSLADELVDQLGYRQVGVALHLALIAEMQRVMLPPEQGADVLLDAG